MNKEFLLKSILELYKKTSSELPSDISQILKNALKEEADSTAAKYTLETIIKNNEIAKNKNIPICQDTGLPTFYISLPKDTIDSAELERTIKDATNIATKEGTLRPNSIDIISGSNPGNNSGIGWPQIHIEPGNLFDIHLILKGGGCENVGTQYSLPDEHLEAGRDISGIKKCILDAIFKAQGKGCAPGFVGVCVGGDRASGMAFAKRQFLKSALDKNTNPGIANLESEIVKKANELKIGPMGFGGNTTLLGCKIGFEHRHIASYFVSISYMCWAFRRRGIRIHMDGRIDEWLI